MNKLTAGNGDKRVPIAVGVLAFVLALLGSQHISFDSGGSATGQPAPTTFAAAVAPTR